MPELMGVTGAAGCVLAAGAAAGLIGRSSNQPAADWSGEAGVRSLAGWLVVLVFIHHASIWLQYLQRGAWSLPDSRLHLQLGQCSVVLLLMALGYVLASHALTIRSLEAWNALCKSALKQFAWPYWLSVAGLFCVVGMQTGGIPRSPPQDLVKDMLRWLGFGLMGTPDLNRFESTWLVMAGSTWITAYAVIPFALLPLFLLVRVKLVMPAGLAASSLALLWIAFNPVHGVAMAAVATGAAARLLMGISSLRRVLCGPVAAACAIALPALAAYVLASAYDWRAIALLATSMLVVGSGNTLFGLLSAKPSLVLGRASPAVYLLHGLFLYLGTRVFASAASIAPLHFWAGMLLLTPLLIATGWLVAGVLSRSRG